MPRTAMSVTTKVLVTSPTYPFGSSGLIKSAVYLRDKTVGDSESDGQVFDRMLCGDEMRVRCGATHSLMVFFFPSPPPGAPSRRSHPVGTPITSRCEKRRHPSFSGC